MNNDRPVSSAPDGKIFSCPKDGWRATPCDCEHEDVEDPRRPIG